MGIVYLSPLCLSAYEKTNIKNDSILYIPLSGYWIYQGDNLGSFIMSNRWVVHPKLI